MLNLLAMQNSYMLSGIIKVFSRATIFDKKIEFFLSFSEDKKNIVVILQAL